MTSFYAAIVTAVGIVLFLRKAWHNYTRLPKIPYVSGLEFPSLTVIVPARNEAANIARAIEAFPPENVIVVDDASTDDTAKIAAEAGARVISAPPLPAGHLGKPNACMAGAAAAETDWLLFIDADTWYARVFAPCLVEYAEDNELQMASVFLHQHCETLAEKILLPYAFALYFTGVNTGAVNARRPSQWLANGQCLLVRRDAYQRLGGHAAVASSVIEDVALAKLAAERSIHARVTRAEHMGNVRMYDSFQAIWRGFQKNSFRFLQINPFTGLQVVMASTLLASWLPVIVWLLNDHLYRQAALFAVVPSVVLFPWYRSAAALLAPVAIYGFQAIAINGMITTITGRKAIWKGREV
jgi:chlorobactene glucosyltransferase